MKTLGFGSNVLGMGLALLLLAGCGGSRGGGTGMMPQSAPPAGHAARGKSWMFPEASGDELLYLAGQHGDTYVYSYPAGTLVGTLSGLGGGSYECVDRVGDVFITTAAGIYEYAHGGTEPINFLPLAPSVGCSIDPVTGNLAVVTFSPSVYIYANAQGTPTKYTDSALYFAVDVAYDSTGNLFVDGEYQNNHFALDRLQKGSGEFKPITTPDNSYIQNAVFQPIAWDGRFLDLGTFQEVRHSRKYRTVVYRLRISGNSASIRGNVPIALQRGAQYPQFWVQDSIIIQPSNKVRSHSFFESFKYPSGKPIEKVNLAAPVDLMGAAVSVAPSGSRIRQ